MIVGTIEDIVRMWLEVKTSLGRVLIQTSWRWEFLQRESGRGKEPILSQSPFTPYIRFSKKNRGLLTFDHALVWWKIWIDGPFTKIWSKYGSVGETEEIICKCFPIYLMDLATMWFCRLELGYIGSYSLLVRSFKSRFQIHMVQSKEAIFLMNIKQMDE